MFSSLFSEASRAQVSQAGHWLLDIMGGAPDVTFKVNYKLFFCVLIFTLIVEILKKLVPSLRSDVDKGLACFQEGTDSSFTPLGHGQLITPLLNTKSRSSMMSYGTFEKPPQKTVSAPSISGPFINLHENLPKISVKEKVKNYQQRIREAKPKVQSLVPLCAPRSQAP